MKAKLISLLFILNAGLLLAQTPGMIFENRGITVLDPNKDGFISKTSAGFTTADKFTSKQSEIPYLPFAVIQSEPTSDPGPGPNCSFNDFDDIREYGEPLYTYFDKTSLGGPYLLYRFRLADYSPNSKSYSVLIDIDGKFGSSGPNADPNYTSYNPGFEIEIYLATNFGVGIYNIDGINASTSSTDPASISASSGTYPYTTYSHKAVAWPYPGGSCDPTGSEYFYDFYIPFSAVQALTFTGQTATNIGGTHVTSSTPMRMVGATVMNPNPGFGNTTLSDFGGVDDSAYGDLANMWQDMIDVFPPTSPDDINTIANSVTPTRLSPRSDCPMIYTPSAGSTTIRGTSTEGNGTNIKVYVSATSSFTSPSIYSTTVTSGTWSVIVPALTVNYYVKATAQNPNAMYGSVAVSESTSYDNCDIEQVSASCSDNFTPVVTGVTPVNGSKGFRGNISNPTGASIQITLYTDAGVVYSPVSNGNPVTTTTTTWSIDNGTGNSFTAGLYYIVAKDLTNNKCESQKVYVCANNNNGDYKTNATAPTITSYPAGNGVTISGGGSYANTKQYIYINDVLIGTSTSTSTTWSYAGANIKSCDVIKVNQYKTNTTMECLSPYASVTVTNSAAAAPTITGSYCVSAASTLFVTGTSTEDDGATIKIYKTGSTQIGTATVRNNAWSTTTTGTVVAGNSIWATAENTTLACPKTTSANSTSVVIGTNTSNAGLTINATTEGTTTVTGHAPTTAGTYTIKLYIDGYNDPTWFVSGVAGGAAATYTINGIAVGSIYAGADLYVTANNGTNCESQPSATIEASCNLALINDNIDFTANTPVCSGNASIITIPNSQTGIFYQVYEGVTPIGYTSSGTGSSITISTGSLTNGTGSDIVKTFKVKATRLVPTTSACAVFLDGTNNDGVDHTANVTVKTNIGPSDLSISYSPSPAAMCAGNTLSITIALSQVGVNYQLFNNETGVSISSIVPGSGGSITLTTSPLSSSLTVRINASSGTCTRDLSQLVGVTIKPLPNATANNNGPVCSGGTLTLSGGAVGNTYSWSGPNGFSSIAMSPTVSTNATTAMSGTYTLTVTGTNGCVNTATTNVTVSTLNPNISINDASTSEGNSGTKSLNFTVSLNAAACGDVSVNYATSNGTATTANNDYTSTSGTLTIPAGNTTGTITVPIVGDKKVEADENFFVALSAASAGNITDASGEATITNDDHSPTISDATIAIDENTANTTTIFNYNETVTGTDFDSDGDNINYTIIDGNSSGAFSINLTTGAITIADATKLDYETTTSFTLTIQATDGYNNYTATITINLNNLNDVSPLINDVSVTISENSPNNTFITNLNDTNTSNDTDREGQAITYTIIGGNASGAFTINTSTGAITVTDYTKLDYESTPTFTLTIRASDGTLTDDATVTINLSDVNEAPSITDFTMNGTEDNTITFAASNFTSHYSDAESTPLNSIKIVTLPTNGVLKLSGINITANQVISATDLSNITFVPNSNWNGTTSFNWNATDGLLFANADKTITLSITTVNDLPTGANNTVTTIKNTDATLTESDFNYNDVDGDALNHIQITALPSAGTLYLDANSNGTVDAGEAVAVNGIISKANIDAGLLKFKPVLNESGIGYANIGFKVNDGTAYSSSAYTLTVDVVNSNTPPTASNNTVSTNEDTEKTFTLAEFNFSDADGNLLDLVKITLLPTKGTLYRDINFDGHIDAGEEVAVNGTISRADLNAGELKFKPVANENGSPYTTFKFTVYDGLAYSVSEYTMTINVIPVNDAPVAVNDSKTTNEDEATTINVTSNDTDIDGTIDPATVDLNPSTAGIQSTISTAAGNWSVNASGVITFTPTLNYFGTATISYVVNDNSGATSGVATLTITVNSVNDSPVASNDGINTDEDEPISINVVANDSDVDGIINPATVDLDPATPGIQSTFTNAAGSWSVNASGVVSYTPAANYNGAATLSYVVNDNSGATSTPATLTVTVNAVNDAPVALADNYSVNEGAALTVAVGAGVLNNDTDVEGSSLTAILVAFPLHGTLTLNANGSFTYVHEGSETTTDSYTYMVNDGTVNGNTVTVTITINPVNDAPIAQPDEYSLTEGGTLTLTALQGVLSNDTDAEGNLLNAVKVTNPAHGTLTFNADGSFTYTHDGSETTSDSFTYKVNDGTTDGNTVTVSIDINPVNDAPVANNDNTNTDEDQTVTFNVTTNDTDVDGTINPSTVDLDPATLGIQSTFTNAAGTWSVNASGVVSFTPAANYYGSATVSYTVKDNSGAISNTGTLSVTVNPINDNPAAIADSYDVNEGTTLNISAALGVLANDTDVDGNALTSTLVATTTHGTLTLNANGSFTYTHDGSETTSDSFTYKVNDGTADGNTVTVTISINPVNDNPVASNDAITTNEDVPISVSVIDNDTDVDGAISISSVDLDPASSGIQTTFTAAAGTWSVNGLGVVTFTPNLNYNGTATLSYTVNDNDGATSNTATLTVTVNAVNDAPVAVADTYSVNEGATLTVAVGLGVLNNDTDVEGSSLTAIVGTLPLHGTLTLNADGSFTYIHDGSEHTSDSFTYTVNDGTVNGNTVTVSITINPVNDPPTASNSTVTTLKNTDKVFSVSHFGYNDADGDEISKVQVTSIPAKGTLYIDLDLDGTVDAGEDLQINDEVSKTFIDAGMLKFKPLPNETGTPYSSFGFKVNDGTAYSAAYSITINVTNTNAAPTASSNTITTSEDTEKTIALADFGFADADGDILDHVQITQLPTLGTLYIDVNHDGNIDFGEEVTLNGTVSRTDINSGELKFKPMADQFGAPYTNFKFKVNDGLVYSGSEYTMTINVTSVNDNPTANGDAISTNEDNAVTINVVANDTDIDGTINPASVDLDPATPGIQSTLTTAEGSWSVNASGVVTFTPALNFNGLAIINYTVNDNNGATSATATVTVTVNAVNDIPVANNDAVTTNEDEPITINVTANDTDVDDTIDPSTVDLDPSTPGIQSSFTSPKGNWTVNSLGIVSFTPNSNYNGTASISYTVNDIAGGTSAQATITITVNAVNDVPVANVDSYSVNEGATLNISAALGVLANDTDVDGNALTAILVATTTHGTLTLNANGSFTYAHDGSETTSDSFTYKVNDGSADGNTVTVTISINPVDDPPTASNASVTTIKNQDRVFRAVNFSYNDPEGAEMDHITITGLPTIGTLYLDANHNGLADMGEEITLNSSISYMLIEAGLLKFKPNTNETGSPYASFEFKVSDGSLSSVSAYTMTINVNDSNTAPTASDQAVTIAEDTEKVFSVADFDYFDLDGDNLNLVLTSLLPDKGLLYRDNNSNGNYDAGEEVLLGQEIGHAHIAAGELRFKPFTNENGSPYTSFKFKVNDGLAYSAATYTMTINVTPVNDSPVAANDTKTTNEDEATTINVTTNDTDIDGTIDPATVDLDPTSPGIQSAHVDPEGSWSVNASGGITFTPTLNYFGTTSISYVVNDNSGATSNIATITITVNPVNDAPETNNDTATTNEDEPITVSVVTNDTDVDGTIDQATVDLNPTTPGIQQTLTSPAGIWVVDDQGAVTFTPNPDYNGTATLNYVVNDNNGAASNVATLTITVNGENDDPVAVADSYVVNEGTTLSIAAKGVLTNDSDIDGDALTAVVGSLPLHGTLTLNADGSFTYTHDGSETTTDNFTYTVNDGTANGNTVTVTITINPINDIPTAQDNTVTTLKNIDKVFSTFYFNFIDTDSYLSAVKITQLPTKGTLYIDSNLNGVIDIGEGMALNDEVNVSAIDAGQLKFKPLTNENGLPYTTFMFKVSDGANYSTSAYTMTINVTDVNHAPIAADKTLYGTEDTPITFDFLDFGYADIDGDPMSHLEISTIPASGALFVDNNLNGLVDFGEQITSITNSSRPSIDLGKLKFLPSANTYGAPYATFNFRVSDGIEYSTQAYTITINIASVNDIPSANNDAQTTDEDQPVVINVLNNDSGLGDGGITVTMATNPLHGITTVNPDGTITYTPSADYNGTDTFEYQVCDANGDCSTAIVTININPVNDIPIAENDAATTNEDQSVLIGILTNDSGLGDGGIIVSINTYPGHGSATLNADNTVTYTPNADFYGNDLLTYQVCDINNECSTATVNIVVNAVNDIPTATNDFATTNEDMPTTINVLNNDSGLGDVNLSITINTPPTNGVTLVNPDGTITYTPNADYNGPDSFMYKVCDSNGDCSTAIVNITVNPVNDNPIAINDNSTTNEDTPVIVNILGNDSGFGDTPTTISINISPTNGTFVINADNTITYTPNPNYNGTDNFTYILYDSNGDYSEATVTVIVNPANDPPTVIGENLSTNEDTPISGNIITNDSDIDGDNLTVNTPPVNGPSHGTVTINPDGSFIYTPNKDYNGTDSFTYQVCDNGTPSKCSTGTVTIVIDPVNDPPVAVNDNYSVNAGATLTINAANGVIKNDIDVDGNTLNTTLVLSTTNGTLTFNTDGSFTYINNGSDVTTDNFTYKTSDGTVESNIAVVTILIDHTPVAMDDNTNTNQNQSTTINILANDLKLIDSPIAVSITQNGAHGTATLNTDNTITYSPSNGYYGADQLKYTLTDADGDSDDATVSITINQVIFDHQPIAQNDIDTTLKNQPITINILSNDSGLEDSPIAISIDAEASNGTTTINADNTVTYNPNSGFVGTDEISYRITDSDGDFTTATITILVKEPIIIPDGFSPDDDGIGDTFIIVGIENFPDNELFIYNRWGSLVYSKKHYNNEWNGRYKQSNEKLPMGTYFFVLNIKGFKEPFKGYVYLKY